MQDLDISIRDAIDDLFIQAGQAQKSGNVALAIQLAEQAWDTLPEPKFHWDVSKSFTHTIAKTYRDAKMFNEALSIMQALFNSGTVKDYQDGSRFILATIYYHQGNLLEAKKWFAIADKISNGRCFREEPLEYFKFYKAK